MQKIYPPPQLHLPRSSGKRAVCLLYLITLFFASANKAVAQPVPFNATGYVQDFQSMSASPLAPATIASTTMIQVSSQPGGGTVSGWYLYHQAAGTPRWGRSNGSSNAGSFYAMYDAAATPDVALGSLGSSGIVAYFGVVLQNNTGATINRVNVSYDAVINRNPSTTVNPFPLSYRVGASSVASGSSTGSGTFNDGAGTWTAGAGFTTPGSGTGAPGTQNTISPLYRIGGTAVSQVLTGLNWAPGQYLYIRWKETDDAGADATAGVDDFSITVCAAPTITAPADLSVTANEGCTASGVSLGTPAVNAPCGVTALANNAPLSFPVGSTTIIWTATDSAGNTAADSQIVVVNKPVTGLTATGGTGTITASATGATEYSVNGVAYQPSGNFTGLAAGVYTVYARATPTGCVDSLTGITVLTPNYTLQILHAADFEASTEAVADAPRFAAIVDTLEHTYPNSVTLSSGDNFIPSPFSYSGEDPRLVPAYKNTYSRYYNTNVSNPPYDLRAGIGRADISILNFIGVEASVLGNHDFDFGTSELRNIIGGNISGSSVRWFGAQFPYLSTNLNFTSDPNLAPVFTPARLPNTAFASNPANTPAQIAARPKLAPSCVIIKNGAKLGIVGVTTPILAAISSPGATTVKNPGAGTNDMTLLATIVQPYVDSLINLEGCNKIILLSHLQQLAFEKELATKLSGVDIIIGGGSNTLLADSTDRLRAGDLAAETYPFFTTGLDGNPLAILNTEGNYRYVGRLVIDFDPAGKIIPASVNPAISGVYAADSLGVAEAWGANIALAFAPGTRGALVKEVSDSIGSAIGAKDGNLFGKTAVFLEGRRNFVRTEETNLGNLSAEANLWMAKFYDSTATVSLKNGGGIRSLIGNVSAVGDSVALSPPLPNPAVGKQLGDVSQLDIENSLRFNNQLSLVTVNAQGLRRLLEHGVAATAPGATPGQFPQMAGVRFSYNPALPAFNPSVPGSGRIVNAAITNDSGTVILDTLVLNGVTYGDTSRTIRVVTLNFLASGGDAYPFPAVSSARVDINTVPVPAGVPGVASFTNPGSEQDAFAEYLKSLHTLTPYAKAETPINRDFRIQNLSQRADSVLNNTAPAVVISSPASPATFNAGSTVNVQVTASDADGSVRRVELFVNGTPFATDSIAPYEFTSTDVEAGIYRLTARATDNTGAVSVSDTVQVTVVACTPEGSITVYGYTNISGGQVSDLTGNPAYPNSPAVVASLPQYEYGPNLGDNYGARTRGYICVPETGNYVFYIASDDQAGLYLSTNDNPANKVLIAYNDSWTNLRQWNKFPSQQSAPIRLIKGARYYIETLHKEANGPDHLSVGWTLPGGTFQGPIAGSYLSPWTDGPSGIYLAGGFSQAMQELAMVAKGTFNVVLAPNPSNSYFTLRITSRSEGVANITVTDGIGRIVERRTNVAANSQVQMGGSLRPGIYFVEVLQGQQKQQIKFIKQ